MFVSSLWNSKWYRMQVSRFPDARHMLQFRPTSGYGFTLSGVFTSTAEHQLALAAGLR
jgi:hypothetical protein